jgi:hopanoid biosynthesis associated protein HpnK
MDIGTVHISAKMRGDRHRRQLITVADDFGLTESVNEAVEAAATRGILTSASLMVGAPAFADAVARARRCPGLHVGLHLVVIEGPAVLPRARIAALTDSDGQFPSDQLRLGFGYAFRPRVRRQLAAEIRAQFEAFAATGLPLDHANAHKHMHLHPVVGQMMIDIGREFGLRAVRVPAEPKRAGEPAGARLLRQWCAILRLQAKRAGMITNDQVLGLATTGHMTEPVVRDLLGRLPAGLTEMYFHPASRRDALLQRLMPDYEHMAEFEALLTVAMPADVELTAYGAVRHGGGPREGGLKIRPYRDATSSPA